MKITVCIGSSCHVHGSRQVVGELQRLIAENNLQDKIEILPTFCMGKCHQGVCITVDDVHHSIKPEQTAEFFEKEILGAF